MQFSDKISQYNLNQGAGTQSPTKINVVKQMASTLRDMKAGQVFEGTVTSVKNGRVTIGLSSGQSMMARMDGKVPLTEGQTMFFQVKSNTENQISIRPFTASNGQVLNPTLYKALEAANLAITPDNLELVDTMMKEQMPIDKNSLLKMTVSIQSNVQTNGNADVKSLVQMTKLGIPLTAENLQQFQNYKSNQHAMMNDFNALLEELPQALGESSTTVGDAIAKNLQIVGLLENVPQIEASQLQNTLADGSVAVLLDAEGNVIADPNSANQPLNAEQMLLDGEMAQNATGTAQTADQTAAMAQNNAAQQTTGGENAQNATQAMAQTAEGVVLEQSAQTSEETTATTQNQPDQIQSIRYENGSVGSLLDTTQMQNLQQQMAQIPQLTANPSLFLDGSLNGNLTPAQMLEQITASLQNGQELPQSLQEVVKDLFSGKEYQAVLKEAFTAQWTLTPEDVREKGNIDQFYDRIQRQMGKVVEMFQGASGGAASAAAKSAGNVSSNLEFMNQINQMYNYVQIPLKLANQKAHSDLYIYTNKRNLQEKEGELSALLHLDMEHLGATDVLVKMKGTKVDTNFYLADDKSFQLIMNNIDILEARLEKLGYDCQIHVENKEEKVDFVEDFLEQEQPVGRVQRYSFDVRA